MRKKKVIAAGHICLDITPIFPDQKVQDLSCILQPGKLIEMGNADVHTGGAVANTGLGMMILGADVSLMGKVGKDSFGDMVLSILNQYHASDHMICTEKESTSYSIVLAIPGIDRIFLHHPGANNTFAADDLPMEELKKASLFHFGYPSIMQSMYRNNGKELLAVMKKAKDAGCATSLDMAAVDANSEAGRVDWNQILKNVIPFVDFFVPSVEELCFMLDRETFARWQERAQGKDMTEVLDIEQDVVPLADQCMAYGAKVLLIKCGAAGMYYRTAQTSKMLPLTDQLELIPDEWISKSGFEKSYLPDRVLSGTGAGDTSIAAFLTSMLEGKSLENCMHLAAAAGASCVAEYDALSGLKPLNELQSRIDAGWKKTK